MKPLVIWHKPDVCSAAASVANLLLSYFRNDFSCVTQYDFVFSVQKIFCRIIFKNIQACIKVDATEFFFFVIFFSHIKRLLNIHFFLIFIHVKYSYHINDKD